MWGHPTISFVLLAFPLPHPCSQCSRIPCCQDVGTLQQCSCGLACKSYLAWCSLAANGLMQRTALIVKSAERLNTNAFPGLSRNCLCLLPRSAEHSTELGPFCDLHAIHPGSRFPPKHCRLASHGGGASCLCLHSCQVCTQTGPANINFCWPTHEDCHLQLCCGCS